MVPKKLNSRTLILDGDTPIFRVAKKLQRDYVEINWNDFILEMPNKTRFLGGNIAGEKIKGKLKEINEKHNISLSPDDFEIIPKTVLINAKSDEHRLAIGKKNMRAYVNDLLMIPWVKNIKWCLSSKESFRKNLNPDYKSNRAEKPKLLTELREWFCKEYKDIVTIKDPIEADDCLGIFGAWSRGYYQNPKDSPFVLTGYDKDLLQIHSNWFFNFDQRDKGIFWVDEFTGHKNLCIQILQGDNADNLKGLPKITSEIKAKYGVNTGGCAIGKAKSILSNCKCVNDLYMEVEWCYRSYYGKDYKKHLNLMYKMVHLLEKENEIKDFPWQL